MKFDNSFARLPERFYVRQAPVPVADPNLVRVNQSLAKFLGIDPAWLESKTGVQVIAGNQVPDGADPIATVYAGHQFGSWNPRLGDGRAILLGEVIGEDGERIRPDTLLTRGGWQGTARPHIARIHRQRSDGRARHSNQSNACGRYHG